MYVFLDIDGVLNKKEQWNRKHYLDKEIEKYLEFVGGKGKYIMIDDDRMEFDKIRELNYFTNAICGFTRADIKGCLKLLL